MKAAAAAGALSIAASAALQFSGLGGPIPTVIAAGTALALAIYLWRTRSGRGKANTAPGLGERCQELGNDLIRFARRRRSENQGSPAPHAHETDTSFLYASNYAAKVVALLRDLVREGCMGSEEANAWMVPDGVNAIEQLGRRLLQLGLAAD
jgi:hypothetical protein